MNLLKTKGKVTLLNNKTNLIHRFDVPENIKAMKIKYSYTPKLFENREKAAQEVKNCFEKYDEPLTSRVSDYLPVKNLITLSVDSNGTYIGAAHRQDNVQEHTISSEYSSPGFIKTKIAAGEWDIMLNVHYVGCDVDYLIEVEGVEE